MIGVFVCFESKVLAFALNGEPFSVSSSLPAKIGASFSQDKRSVTLLSISETETKSQVESS